MKNIIYSLLSGLAFIVLLGACKATVNDQFEGLDNMIKSTNLTAYNYTLLDADYAAISKSALSVAKNNVDSTAAKNIATNKYFTNTVPSSTNVPFLLKTKYLYADLGSTANITSSFGDDRPTYLSDLTTVNILADADYKSAWGSSSYVGAFTPAVSPSAKLPALLATKFPTATTGLYKFVEYNYSNTDAVTQSTEVSYFSEDWTSHSAATASPYTVIAENGWISKDVLASLNWYCRVFSGNNYAQVTSNGSLAINESWMISKEINLQTATAPKFTFDVTIGYWNANCLTVLISTNFDGTTTGIATAAWTDITSSFTIPATPASGYGTATNSGIADLSAYAGKKVRIAFKYSGDGRSAAVRGTAPLKSTTYQIDNIKVSETKVALSVASTEKQYVAYTFNGTAWVPAATSSFVSLQPADYIAIGLSYISSANAPLYIPQLLSQKFPFAQEGNVKTAVYKSSSNVNYSGATQYTFTKGVWVPNSFKSTKTEQYIYSNSGWVFDPTIKLPLVVVSGGNPYIQKFIDYVRTTTPSKFFQKNTYINEEHYYGFSAYYAEIICTVDRTTYGDPAIKALTTDVAKNALFLDRVKEAMPIFTQVNFPNLTTDVSGIQQYVIVTIISYYSSSRIGNLTIKMKCTKSGNGATPAEYVVDSFTETF
jgi:hypothetical protein